jgi:hypothetical protein
MASQLRQPTGLQDFLVSLLLMQSFHVRPSALQSAGVYVGK